jgi:hypothetical protein
MTDAILPPKITNKRIVHPQKEEEEEEGFE